MHRGSVCDIKGRSISYQPIPLIRSTTPAAIPGRDCRDTTGLIEETVFTTDTLKATPELDERLRRKANAIGTPVKLADGSLWLLANPKYRPSSAGLTRPLVDRSLDRIFECTVFGEGVPLSELFEVARALLKANYELSDDEIGKLLSVSQGHESQTVASEILNSLFGVNLSDKTYTSWVRASLAANGLCRETILAQDVVNILGILVSTGRTIPLSKFADACLVVDERARLETLI